MTNRFDHITDIYYIKLGERGRWEQSCIEEENNLRFGFNPAPHNKCLDGNWNMAEELKKAGYKKITDTIRQIKTFYTSDRNVLWVTFYKGKLWWCFSLPEIHLQDDGSKTRTAIGSWQSTDIHGIELEMNLLSGKLIRTQRFQGTICKISERDYLIQKITGQVRPEVENARKAQIQLERSIQAIIEDLTPKDFEILIDLIFRESGWRRISVLGGTQKLLDLDLVSPITKERYGVQIKSEASLKEFYNFVSNITGLVHNKFYFVVHSPGKGLMVNKETDNVKILLPDHIANLAVKYGLADWIINKGG